MKELKSDTLDFMMDLETLSLRPNAVILEVSAVAFELGVHKNLGEFDEFISPKSCLELGMDLDGQTAAWWLGQDDKVVNEVLIHAIQNGAPLKDVLENFSNFIKDTKEKYGAKRIRVWGNGVDADNVWMKSAYDLAGVKMPWRYNENEHVRTLVELGKRFFGIDAKSGSAYGMLHRGIDDCIRQIDYCDSIGKVLLAAGEKFQEK